MEIISSGLYSKNFKLLICFKKISYELITFVMQIDLLQEYIDSQGLVLKFELFLSGPEIVSQSFLIDPGNLKVSDVDDVFSLAPEDAKSLIEKLSVDLVYLDDPSLQKLLAEQPSCFVGNLDEIRKEIEIFVKGHELPWSFSNQIYNMGWNHYYPICNKTTQSCADFFFQINQKIFTDKPATEMARGLVHVTNYIAYTHDRLLFLEQQKNYAKRQGWEHQDFSFERGYYLNHYYILLKSFLDQVAIFTDRILKLGISNKFDIDLGKDKFKKAIKKISPEMYTLFTKKQTVEWLQSLGPRDYIAHRGSIVLVPLIQEPKDMPSRSELEKEISESEEYKEIKALLPEFAEGYKQMGIELLNIKKHKVVFDDIATISTFNGERQFYLPMKSVKWHFEQLQDFLTKYQELIKKYLAISQDH